MSADTTPPARPPRVFFSEMKPGDRADGVFLINNVQLGTKRNGEPFLKMMVSDRTGRVAAKWWDRGPEMVERLPDPGVVRVKGRMEEFGGAPQFVIDNVFQADPRRIDYSELLPSTDKNVGQMWANCEAMLRGLSSPTLRDLAAAYLDDAALMEDFRRAPAAMTFHHAYLGGLLDHTLNAMRSADAVCGLYPGLNRDLVIFGVFVHDLAKTWELSYDTAFDYTDGGRLVGHVVKSAMWVEAKAKRAEEMTGRAVPRDVVEAVEHLILAHHGEHSLGFGSAKSPATPEAWAVHMIENLDAKLTMALAATRWEGGGTGRWTDYHRAFDGKLFRPDVVAEADAARADSPAKPAEPAAADETSPAEAAPQVEESSSALF